MTEIKNKTLAVGGGSCILQPDITGRLWRLEEGLLALETTTSRKQTVLLALPGDLVGVESLFDQPCRFDAKALTPVRLTIVAVPTANKRPSLMGEALHTLQQRSLDMASLRTGPVAERLGRYLQLAGHGGHPGEPYPMAHSDRIRRTLPALRDLAELVDAKTETVCRALAHLLPKPTNTLAFRLPTLTTLPTPALAA